MPMSASLNEPRPLSGLSHGLIGGGAWLKARQEDKDRANFEPRNHSAACRRSQKPIERVAAFLVAVSRNNSYEGRDPNAIPDFLSSGFVADLLGLSIDLLADVLRRLASLGVVHPGKVAGLLIKDLAALERLRRALNRCRGSPSMGARP
jgi:CRP/FNR family transcriptional regulator, anaerobic regulatory protein